MLIIKNLNPTQTLLKPIEIGDFSIFPNIYLSSMHGVTDYPFRQLIQHTTNHNTGLLTSEFISAKELFYKNRKAVLQMKFNEQQRPFCVQIYGGEPSFMIQTAKIAEMASADMIEINSGCPSPRVVKRQCGSGLLLDLNHFQKIVNSVVQAVSLPVSVKVRIGYTDNNINVLESHHIAQEEGASLFVIHGRTRQQGYKGLANWEIIGEVKARSKIPIVGNGDVLTLQHALDKIKIYGVDGISIGRGVLHNPWLLRDVSDYIQNKPKKNINTEDQINLFKNYFHFLMEESQSEIFSLGRLKQIGSCILKTYNPQIKSIQTVLKARTLIDFFKHLEEFFKKEKDLQLDSIENLNSYKSKKLEFGNQY